MVFQLNSGAPAAPAAALIEAISDSNTAGVV